MSRIPYTVSNAVRGYSETLSSFEAGTPGLSVHGLCTDIPVTVGRPSWTVQVQRTLFLL